MHLPYQDVAQFVLAASNGFEFHHQRPLLPNQADLLIQPVSLIATLYVEVPQKTCNDQFHLDVSQITANTVTWPIRERLEGFSLVVVVDRIFMHPALRNELVGVVEVALASCGAVEGDADCNITRHELVGNHHATRWGKARVRLW